VTEPNRPLGSRLLHGIDRTASRPGVGWALVAVDVAWVVFSIAFGFPARLETIFQTLVAALTLAMVFVIQHTQTREQLVTQRKLDEILRALPGASNAFIALEEAPDAELHDTHASQMDLRDQAVQNVP
jgi:low affinity Fe/Cu permease